MTAATAVVGGNKSWITDACDDDGASALEVEYHNFEW